MQHIIDKFKMLSGITITENKVEKTTLPEKNIDLDFYEFWDSLKTPYYKAIFLISLRSWANGVKFLNKIIPAIEKRKGEVKDGNTIMELFNNANIEDCKRLIRQNSHKESYESLQTLLKLLEKHNISRRELNLL